MAQARGPSIVVWRNAGAFGYCQGVRPPIITTTVITIHIVTKCRQIRRGRRYCEQIHQAPDERKRPYNPFVAAHLTVNNYGPGLPRFFAGVSLRCYPATLSSSPRSQSTWDGPEGSDISYAQSTSHSLQAETHRREAVDRTPPYWRGDTRPDQGAAKTRTAAAIDSGQRGLRGREPR